MRLWRVMGASVVETGLHPLTNGAEGSWVIDEAVLDASKRVQRFPACTFLSYCQNAI